MGGQPAGEEAMDRGSVIRPFTRSPDCPKCKGIMFSWKYVPSGQHLERIERCPVIMGDNGEHLDLTCRDCGYVIGMKAADA